MITGIVKNTYLTHFTKPFLSHHRTHNAGPKVYWDWDIEANRKANWQIASKMRFHFTVLTLKSTVIDQINAARK